jgi:hypothetical protein
VDRCNLLLPLKLEVALPFTSSVVYPECSFDERDQRPLVSGVAKIYTKPEDADHRPSFRYHEADLEGEIHC